jgi:hypothetical protein
MHDLEPFYNWEHLYRAYDDPHSPFYGVSPDRTTYEHAIYSYYIHPEWDYIGSETLYIKLLFTDYKAHICVIELFGEWNDALHNDIMHLKRNVIDVLTGMGIRYYLLIGENILNFHGSDDCYYEEWFEDVEEGWIVLLNFRSFVLAEMTKYGLDQYLISGGILDSLDEWRTYSPQQLYLKVKEAVSHRLG